MKYFFLSLLFFSITFILKSQTKQLPNIVLILADDLGIGDISAYNFAEMETPNMDFIAKKGMKFTNFYSNSPVCSPTRAAILSGKYAGSVGISGLVRANPKYCFGNLKNNVKLLPKFLQEKHYNTALIGKWNLGLSKPDLPNNKGFNYFIGFLNDKVDDYNHHKRNGFEYMFKNKEKIKPVGHLEDLYNDWAVHYIKTVPKNKPFFMMLSLNMPHNPIQPKQNFIKEVLKNHQHKNCDEVNYLAFIKQLDTNIGKVINELKTQNIFENTMIILTSDNGGSIYHGSTKTNYKGTKAQMYEGGIRIPFLVSYPNLIAQNTSNNSIASTVDVLPTIAELVDIKTNFKSDGKSILPAFKNANLQVNSKSIFFERLDVEGQTYAYRKGDYKIIKNENENKTSKYECYHLKNDVAEKTDLWKLKNKTCLQLKDSLNNLIAITKATPYRNNWHFLKQLNYDLKIYFRKLKNYLNKKF